MFDFNFKEENYIMNHYFMKGVEIMEATIN